MQVSGYIYIRTNEYWDYYNACKLGKTTNIADRENIYITSEIKRGKYELVIEVDLEILDILEIKLQNYFNELNLQIYFDAGTEFYKKEILELIIDYLDKENIIYKILSEEEINNFLRKEKDNNNYYRPRDYQLDIINNALKYFEDNNKGLLVIPCGVGKTLISLWITQRLYFKKILIGVPNTLLLEQWKEAINIVFLDIPKLLVYSGITEEDIINFLQNNKENIVITTYSSAYKIKRVTKILKYMFDMKIHDETHHLTSFQKDKEEKKSYIKMIQIKAIKELSLTATLKVLENKEDVSDEDIIISNDNINYFGEIIEKRSLLWAITENIVCDYEIQTIVTLEEEINEQLELFEIKDSNDKRMFLSAYASLKSIQENKSHHLLVYCNNKENTKKIIDYINKLLSNNYFNIPEIYYSNYHSEMKDKEQKDILNNFNKTKYSILSCVYCLGEGYDNKIIDGVVFSENMSSNIRIVQSTLRASRKNIEEPNKITKIILPILNTNKIELLEDIENQDLKKIRQVIYQLGLEDNLIIEKIKVYNMKINKNNIRNENNGDIENKEEVCEYNKELTELLRLKTITRLSLEITYERAKKIIKNNNIQNKSEYYNLCKKDYRLPEDPELHFKESFKNWIDYLNIEKKYYDLETCKKKVNEYLRKTKINHLEIEEICSKLCNENNNFPPSDLWSEYYDISNLSKIIKKNKKIDI